MIHSLSADRLDLLHQLEQFTEDEEVEQVFQLYLSAGEAGVATVRWLVRYLLRVNTRYALSKISTLAQSSQIAIREEGRSGLLKIDSDIRLDLLLHLAQASYDREACFAIDWLGEWKVKAAIDPLLEIYQERVEEQIHLHIVRALGGMESLEALVVLEALLHTATGKIEQAILSALGRIVEVSKVSVILNWLESEDPRLRSLAAFKLLSKKGRRWERYVAKELQREEQTELKVDLLNAVVRVRTLSLFREIVQIALFDSNQRVRLVAQSVIRKIRSPWVREALMRYARRVPEENLPPLLDLLSDYHEDVRVVETILRYYHLAKGDPLRFAAIGALGHCGNRMALPFLLKLVVEDKGLGSAAALSFASLATWDDLGVIEELLRKRSLLPGYIAQSFLQMLCTLEQGRPLPSSLQQLVAEMMEVGSLKLRYLAIRLFVRCNELEQVERLVDIAVNSPFLRLRGAAERGVRELVLQRPLVVNQLLALFDRFPAVIGLVCRIAKQVGEGVLPIRAIIKQLLKFYDELSESRSSRPLRLVVAAATIVESHPIEYIRLIRDEEWSDLQLARLLWVLNLTHLYEMGGLRIDFLVKLYPGSGPEVKSQILHFLLRFQGDSREAQQVVFEALETESDPETVKELRELIFLWVARATPSLGARPKEGAYV